MTDDTDGTEPYWQSSLDQQIGSIIEGWTTRETGGYCRFCALEYVGDDVDPSEQFCSDECEEHFQTVGKARILIGQRDMAQRGYD